MVLALVLTARASEREESLEDLLDLMDDRLDEETSVADHTEREERAASALVTTLTGAELEALGARDLMDALRLIPSIEFGGDLWNTVQLVARGTPSEGRVLVLLDGHEWNEGMYGSVSMGNRLPISAIERIEVVRGPGSAIYGGHAMLAVVRITTRAASYEGLRLDGTASVLGSGVYGRQDATLSAGAPLGEDGHLGVTAALGRGRRSDGIWVDKVGRTLDLTDTSALDPALLSTSFTLGSFEGALAGERYWTSWQDGALRVIAHEHENVFSGIYGRLGWQGALGERADLRLSLRSDWQEPWRSTAFPTDKYGYTRDRVDRHTAIADVELRPTSHWTLQEGAEAGLQRGHSPVEVPSSPVYERLAAWSEAGFQGPVNVTAGVRVDASTAFGTATSPRLVVGQAWRAGHIKLAANHAFRAPDLAQARSAVHPETLWSLEAEGGLAPTSWTYLTLGVFRTWLDDPISYFYAYDPAGGELAEGYRNGDAVGTGGLEAAAEVLSGPLSLTAGWSSVGAAWPGAGEDYAVPSEPARRLGIPAHKGVLRATLDPGDRFSMGMVVTGLGPRWAIVATSGGLPQYEELPMALLLDASARLRHVAGIRGLSVGLSVHDLLDQAPPLVQPYNDLHTPLPDLGREVLLQLTLEPKIREKP